MNKVLKFGWFATKVGLGGGIIYMTVDQGIWGNSREAAAAYDRLYDIMPGTKSVSEKYLSIPKKEVVNVNFRSYWNTGVFYTFDFLANIPAKVVGLKDYVADFASSPPGISSKPSADDDKTEENKKEESQPEATKPEEIVNTTPPEAVPDTTEKSE